MQHKFVKGEGKRTREYVKWTQAFPSCMWAPMFTVKCKVHYNIKIATVIIFPLRYYNGRSEKTIQVYLSLQVLYPLMWNYHRVMFHFSYGSTDVKTLMWNVFFLVVNVWLTFYYLYIFHCSSNAIRDNKMFRNLKVCILLLSSTHPFTNYLFKKLTFSSHRSS